MPLGQRSFQGSADWDDMLAVVQAQPSDHLHVVDLPYRLCSWAFDESANCSLWQNAHGHILAWAVLQSPFWTIDYAIHPAAPSDTLARVLAWADQRAQAVRDTLFARPMWFINTFTNHSHEQAIEASGFHSQTDVGENSWTKVLFHRDVTSLPGYHQLPEGFHIRPLNGSGEVDAYVALHRNAFQSESMTSEWRQRILRHPAYLPQLDLVLVAPNNELAGFCIGWFAKWGPNNQPSGRIEPMGTRTDLQGQGLGKALLNECLARLARLGATSIAVESDNHPNATFSFYESVGFRVAKDITVYRKDYAAAGGQV